MTNAKGVLEWMEWKEKRERNMTNEEWFCGLSTEEKARFFASNKLNFDYQMWIEWLKEKHNGR